MDLVPLSRPRLWKNKADFFRPFRAAAAAAETGENIAPLYDPALHRKSEDEPDLKELNAALAALVDIFPDIEPEVFREMLLSVSEESRLQIVTEHLLTKKATWARGRFRTPQDLTKRMWKKQQRPDPQRQAPSVDGSLAEEASFRSDSYKKSVKQVFYQEFKSLSHSSIRAVLAEQNFSYTLARPILQQLATKSWRFSLSNFWSKRSPSTVASDHPYIFWQGSGVLLAEQTTPAVKRTGNPQLDHELYELFVAPVLQGQRQAQLSGDYQLAQKINEKEAEDADALFDCECCYTSVPFAQLSSCDNDCHQLCFECVRRTVKEALFGQGWARTVDLERSSVRCFAPTTMECGGVIPPDTVRRALSGGSENDDAWNEFQLRTASDILSKSQLRLQRCPFCSYAEVDETPTLRYRSTTEILRYFTIHTSESTKVIVSILAASLLFLTLPLLLLVGVAWATLRFTPAGASLLTASWSRVHHKRRGLRFHCRNPSCRKSSCTRCLSRWHDPHICFENEKTSLRTAIEASATAAVKRTCPKCFLSFVKSSGCNKLVCNCGYTMCYICRQEITSKEGYSHFCQHFRPHGGRCVECERCDLYGDEDEEAAIRRAAEAAEKAWKEKEGVSMAGGDQKASQAMVEALIGQARGQRMWEMWLDGIVDVLAL